MKGLLHPESITALPSVSQWLEHAGFSRALMEQKHPTLSGDEAVIQAAKENIAIQIKNLHTHPSVRSKLDRGALQIHGWMYTIETCEVLVYDPATDQFGPLSINKSVAQAAFPG